MLDRNYIYSFDHPSASSLRLDIRTDRGTQWLTLLAELTISDILRQASTAGDCTDVLHASGQSVVDSVLIEQSATVQRRLDLDAHSVTKKNIDTPFR